MTARINYTQVSENIDYAILDKKLEQLATQPPPKKRKRAGDLLAPVADKLRKLRGKGWGYEQLAKELSETGLPVKASTLRDYLTAKKAKLSRQTK